MKFASLLGNKYFLWLVIGLGVAGAFGLNSYAKSQYEQRLATYQRQVAGQLSDKERELQGLNTTLGISQSQLVTQKELNKKLQADKDSINADFEKFKKEHDLIIKSKDETIAELRQQIIGGQSDTDASGCILSKDCVISYSWADIYNRFQLKDPNIFVKDNEIFSGKQTFVIKGEVYKQKNGFLETRRVQLNEVYKTVENGKDVYKPIPGSKTDIIDASFIYTNEPNSPDNRLFRPRVIGLFGYDFTNLRAGLGAEFMNYKNFGINTHVSVDTKNWKGAEQKLGILYSPKIFGNVELNAAVGASVGTPYTNLLKQYSLSVDLAFYLNN
ncbi:MAG: hypothetical protein WC523_00605 [Patescibacteria group bacterium]